MATMNNKGHYFLPGFTTIKKSAPSFDGTPDSLDETDGSESDLVFYIGDACIE